MKNRAIKIGITILEVSILIALLLLKIFDNTLPEYFNHDAFLVKNDNNSKVSAIVKFSQNDSSSVYVVNENLCDKGRKEIIGAQKTDWFYVSCEEEYLCMYGGFNYAVWEFSDGKKTIETLDHSYITFNSATDTSLSNKCTDVVKIPEGSKACRVTYLHNSDIPGLIYRYAKGIIKGIVKSDRTLLNNEIMNQKNISVLSDQELYITYGRFPSTSKPHVLSKYGEKRSTDGSTVVEISLIEGDTIFYPNNAELELVYGETENDDGEYGIEYGISDSSIVCKRIMDAENLHANFIIGNEYAGIYDNDFDSIYPWSEIKECFCIDGKIVYDCKNESELDSLIEIPKFYFRRVRENGVESISICREQREGYELDPAFIDEQGNEIEHLYVGKYLSSISNKEITSAKGTTPLIDLSYNEINELAAHKGKGWSEIDITALNCIQRLWLVEYGVRNSQAIFEGFTESTFIQGKSAEVKTAKIDSKNSNKIRIVKNEYTEKFKENDGVSIITYSGEDEFGRYIYWTNNYENDNDSWQRKIEKITTVFDSKEEREFLDITISGPPVDILKNATAITHLPKQNGMTDSIDYHTGETDGPSGLKPFKYRNIENIWGCVCVFVSGIYVDTEGSLVYCNYDKRETALYSIPVQKKGGSVAYGYECAIRELSYLPDNASIMFPYSLGSNLAAGFGDWFVYPKDEPDSFDRIKLNEKRYVTYGMTWDLSEYAGLFAFRVYPTENTRMVENGSRLIYRQ